MAERRNDFSQGSVARAIMQLAVPITAAQLINILYNLVDRMYIGHIPGSGALALTGLGLCMPVISLVAAFTRLCSTGGAPLCSIERGRGDLEKAARIQGNAFLLLLIFGAVLTAFGLAFMKPILYAFGASDATWPYAGDYCRIYLLGNLFVMISLGMNSFINSQGFAKTGMMTVLLGAVVNIVLDPIFIFLFDMGVRGAALATVIAQGCSALWVLRFLTGKKAILRLRLKDLKPDFALIRQILSLGLAGFIMAATNSLVQIVANRTLYTFGGDLYVGVMTIINSIREIVMMPIQGITNGSEPVIGYNYGAKCYGRVRKSIQFTLVVGVAYNVAVWALMMLAPTFLMKIFTADAATLAAGPKAIRIYYMCYAFMALQFCGQSTFVALGRSKQAIFFSMLRKVIVVVPMMLLLPHIGGLGVFGVFLSEPISDATCCIVCFVTMILTVWIPMKKLEKEQAV